MTTQLCELAEKYIVDKTPKYNHYYTEEYHKILKGKKYSSMLEIGIGYPELMKKFTNENYKSGASLFMWRDYFKDCIIHGADIKEFNITEENIKIHQCDQSKVDSLEIMMKNIGNVDFIVDDGSHILEHQILTFQTLNNYCKDIYIIEDVKPENIEKICGLAKNIRGMSDGNWIVSSFKHVKDSQGFVCFQKEKYQKIFYINLDSREDRKEHIENILSNIPNIERVSAIKDERGGYFGCVRSHILCLKLALARNYGSVIILEDDFKYKDNRNISNMDIPEKFDMLLLSNLITKQDTEEYNNKFDRVFKAQWTSGYLIHQNFYQKLIDTFEESLQKISEKYCRKNYLDIYWNKLFKDNLILKHKKIIGGQLENDFSNIQNKVIQRINS
jgi:hypothetical protein